MKLTNSQVQVTLVPRADQLARCVGCAAEGLALHEHVRCRIPDLPMVGQSLVLDVTLRRLACPRCGQRRLAVVPEGSWHGGKHESTRELP